MQTMVAQRLDQSQGPDGDDLGGIFRDAARDFDVALRAEVIDFVGVTDRRVREVLPPAIGKRSARPTLRPASAG
jgi:hypothetical protein